MRLIAKLIQKIVYKFSMTNRGSYYFFKKETQGRKLYKKKNVKKQKVHVIANGPSANETIPYIKPGEDVIVVNYALREKKIRQLQPKIIVIVDPAYAQQEFAIKYLDEIYMYLNDGVVERVAMNTIIYQKWKEKYPIDKVEVINSRSISDKYNTVKDQIAYEKNIYAPMFQTVPIAALYVAIQEGYKEIILHGNDFNYMSKIMVDERCHLCLLDQHYYGEKRRDLTAEAKMDFEVELAADLRAIRGYKQVRAYAEDEGVTIYNVSMNSMLDMFEKKRIEAVCQK